MEQVSNSTCSQVLDFLTEETDRQNIQHHQSELRSTPGVCSETADDTLVVGLISNGDGAMENVMIGATLTTFLSTQ